MKNTYKKMYDLRNDVNLLKNPRIKIMEEIITSLRLKNKKILDIGCYDGSLLSMIGGNNELYGLDASDYSIKESKKRGINVKQFFFDDVDKIPFDDNYFDLIIAGEVIEHIFDTDYFLDEVYRLLKSDGHLLISTPNIASLGRRLMLLLGLAPLIDITPNKIDSSGNIISAGHIRYFTFKTLKNFLLEHKFKLINSKSDIVNFSNNGRYRSYLIAKIIPAIGQSLIILTKKCA